MGTFIIRRLLQTIVVLFFVSVIVFSLMQLIPGDPVVVMLGDTASEEQIEFLREELGLNDPLPMQYLKWIGGVVKGDLGNSIVYKQQVTEMIGPRLLISAQLAFYSIVIAVILGIPLGIIAAVKRGSIIDSAILILSNVGVAVPNFWLAILAVYVFGLQLGWLPVHGYVPISESLTGHIRTMFLPSVILGTSAMALFARQTRSSMLDVIRQDYMRTARSKGLKESTIILKHGLRNGLIPIVTLLGLALGNTIGLTVLVETVFNIPGISSFLVNSIFSQDYIVVQGCVLVLGVIVVFANLLADITYTYIDPNIRNN